MRHFPAFLDLAGRTALVLGTGEIADRKAALLARCGATLRRAAFFAPALLDGVALAVGAEATEADLHALSATCLARGVPVNVVDRPELCSFIMPAIVDRKPITIAISTGGAAPSLARALRARIEAAVAPEFGRLAAWLGGWSARLREKFPDLPARRRAIDAALNGAAAQHALAGATDAADTAMQAAMAGTSEGFVWLVGAGPGDRDLLTLRAHRLLTEADVIVHDRLVGDGVLDLARRDATFINVGKAAGRHSLPQDEINALLVRLAREGRRVVRLKGGDPFIFGRGGEEFSAVREAGIGCAVVPGVTAALACAAQAAIPLTQRHVANSLLLVTGHACDGAASPDAELIARHRGTTAIYMGLAALARLAPRLIAAGLDPATPAAAIEAGGSRAMRCLRAPFATLVEQAAAWAGGGPCLILIGESCADTTTQQQAAMALA
jgi:uroporphyrin-III C-methyltransferase/precorrin-2 dehydrogenase/sirohydrochlorin ferrochelatase